jgi:hypothetical protein
MLTMESTRKDVFPFKKDSPLHNIVLSSYEASPGLELLGLLANISRASEILSGESSGFESIITKEILGTGQIWVAVWGSQRQRRHILKYIHFEESSDKPRWCRSFTR